MGDPPTIEVVWCLRDRSWYTRGLSSQEWRQISAVHLPENETDLTLLETARSMYMPREARGAVLRKLEPTCRLPKGDSP
jgi:hypothetical protein